MVRIFRILLCISLLYAGVASGQSAASAVADAVDRYRRGDSELRIDFDAAEFKVIEGRRQPLPSKELQKLENPTLSVGASGADVRALQSALVDSGHLQSEPDGKFGPTTRAAVIAFQTEHGIAADGKVGRATREALELPSEPAWKRHGTPVATELGPRMRYTLDDGLELESALGGAGTREPWTRIAYASTLQQPRGAWPDFLHGLVDQGLMSLESGRNGDMASMELTFAAAAASAPLGPDRLTLSRETLRLLKLSAKYSPRIPQGREWIILVHEPHSNINGHLQLVPGLHELAQANPQLAFEFLVEGDRPDRNCPPSQATCDIPIASVEELLADDQDIRRQQVQYLLRNYLIDSPLAYRLLYDDAMPALAIDDPVALKNSPRSTLDQGAAAKVLQKLPNTLFSADIDTPAQQRQLRSTLQSLSNVAEQFMANQNSTEERLDRFTALIAANRQLAKDLRQLDATRYGSQATALDKYANDLAVEARIVAQVPPRDKTMVKNIVASLERSEAKRIPVVFIGSAHTAGMISRLPAHYGYVVLEPRTYDYASSDNSRFNDALHAYPKALAAARGQLRKLGVLPPTPSLPELGDLLKSVKAKVLSRTPLDGAALDSASTDAIRAAIDRNAQFNMADVRVATDGPGEPPLPPGFDGAFASFSPGSGGSSGFGSGRLLRLLPGKRGTWDDAARDGWKKPDRLGYLERAIFVPPFERDSQKARRVTFYADPTTQRTFVSAFVAERNTYYLFESDRGLDGLAALIDPTVDIATARARLGELLRQLRIDRS